MLICHFDLSISYLFANRQHLSILDMEKLDTRTRNSQNKFCMQYKTKIPMNEGHIIDHIDAKR